MIVQASTMCSLYMYNLIQLKYMGTLPCIFTSDGGGGGGNGGNVCVCVNKCFKRHFYYSRTTVPNYSEIHAYM